MNYRNYEATIDNFEQVLEQYGVCMIPNIVDTVELGCVRSHLWSEISTLLQGRFDINDQSTWVKFHELFPLYGMMVHHFKVGHLQSVWDTRSIPAIGDVFAKFYDVQSTDLCTSFDAISVSMPPEVTGKGWYEGKDWFHLDHSPKRKGFGCIQGLVNLYDVKEGDATLRILEGSHRHSEELFTTVQEPLDRDWFPLTGDQKQFYLDRGCTDSCVLAPSGSLVLWDSRTVHQGVEPQEGRKEQNFRTTFYICMRPRSLFTSEQLQMRKEAFDSLRMTNHWGISLFNEYPDIEGQSLPTHNEIQMPILTDYARSLI